jgi:hypothetical protein
MKLEKSIILHATEDAKKKYKKKKNTRKSSCPSCEIEALKKFEIRDGDIIVDDENDYIESVYKVAAITAAVITLML